jgi:hypothetical protein
MLRFLYMARKLRNLRTYKEPAKRNEVLRILLKLKTLEPSQQQYDRSVTGKNPAQAHFAPTLTIKGSEGFVAAAATPDAPPI